MDLSEERQLVERARYDQGAFGILFDRYYPVIFKYVLKRVADVADAQDITSETFFRAMNSIAKYNWRGVSISSWFYKIATNELRQYYRHSKYDPASLDALFERDGFEPAADQNILDELIEAQEKIARHLTFQEAHNQLASLPLKYQEVIMLRFNEGWKITEIALILGKREER